MGGGETMPAREFPKPLNEPETKGKDGKWKYVCLCANLVTPPGEAIWGGPGGKG